MSQTDSTPSYVRNICEGSLAIMQNVAQAGDAKSLAEFVCLFRTRFEAVNAADLHARFDDMVVVADRLEHLEKLHGVGFCLQLDHPYVVALMNDDGSFITNEMIKRAQSSNFDVRDLGVAALIGSEGPSISRTKSSSLIQETRTSA